MNFLTVAAGGFIGAILRYGISEWMGTIHGFPADVLIINLVGSFFLAWFYTWTSAKVHFPASIRLGVGTGIVGAFTTFSTFCINFWSLWTADLWLESVLYVALSILLGTALAFAGFALAEWQQKKGRTNA